MKPNPKYESLLFNAFRSRHYQLNPTNQNVTGLFSVILQTMFKPCLLLVCAVLSVLFVTGLLTVSRSQLGGDGWVSPKGIFRTTQVISIKLCQGKEVCEGTLSILIVLTIIESSSSWTLRF